jgi:hypothetical protein
MSDEELCKSLRSTLWGQGHHINIKAADRIEALTAERDEALNQLDSARHSVDVLEKRVAGLMSKLAKAAEALREVDALDPEGMIDGCSQSALRGLVLRMGHIARATLAEIDGENG